MIINLHVRTIVPGGEGEHEAAVAAMLVRYLGIVLTRYCAIYLDDESLCEHYPPAYQSIYLAAVCADEAAHRV